MDFLVSTFSSTITDIWFTMNNTWLLYERRHTKEINYATEENDLLGLKFRTYTCTGDEK